MPSVHESMFAASSMPLINHQFGVTVTLSRGPLCSEPITVRREQTETVVNGQDIGFRFSVELRDYLIPIAGLIIDGDIVEPAAGDVIIEAGEHFEVLPNDDYTTSHEREPGTIDWRLHTKRIDNERC